MAKVKNLNKKILYAILLLAFLMIFFRLGRADTLTDGSHYSFRAVGYLDFLGSETQQTPIQWFDKIPFWSKLSFHDAPPLVFFVQHIFFLLFGESVIVARLPFALAGMGTVYLIYLVIRKLYSEKVALLTAFILSISTFFTWSSRITYLESIATFFIILTCYFLVKAVDRDKYFWFFGASLGLAFLTKYTTFFILPLSLAYIYFKNKKLFFNKKFILSLFVALVIFSPVIIYNLKMYQTRGHFDVQFSRLLKEQMFTAAQKDWSGLFHDSMPKDIFYSNFQTIWNNLRLTFSPPFYYALIFSVIIALIIGYQKRKNPDRLFLPLSLFFITLLFFFVAPSTRYLPIFNPFLAACLAVAIFWIYKRLIKYFSKNKILVTVLIILCIGLFGYELYFNLNTNHFIRPVGAKGSNYSEIREENYGYNNLIKALELKIKNQDYYKISKKINQITDIDAGASKLTGKDIFVYESSMNWFATVWYFDRLVVYHNVFFISDALLASILGLDVNWFEFFQERGVKDVYYIKVVDTEAFDKGRQSKERQKFSQDLAVIFEDNITDSGRGDIEEIKAPQGNIAFKIYRLSLSN